MKQAMLLAAGFGKRLRPLTNHTPKPLIKVGGKALIEWHLARLAQAGIEKVVINTSWLGEQIQQHVQDGQQWGLRIYYSPEPEPMETATGVKRALPLLDPAPFLLISSDVWCPWPLAPLQEAAMRLSHESLLAHLLLVNNPPHHPKGDMVFAPHPQTRPRTDENTDSFTYSGIAVVHPKLFEDCDPNTPTPLRTPLWRAMHADQVTATVIPEPWFDVGTIERLNELKHYLASTAQEGMI